MGKFNQAFRISTSNFQGEIQALKNENAAILSQLATLEQTGTSCHASSAVGSQVGAPTHGATTQPDPYNFSTSVQARPNASNDSVSALHVEVLDLRRQCTELI